MYALLRVVTSTLGPTFFALPFSPDGSQTHRWLWGDAGTECLGGRRSSLIPAWTSPIPRPLVTGMEVVLIAMEQWRDVYSV